MSGEHQCLHMKEFLELSHFTGKIEEAVQNIRDDINGLGKTIRDMSKGMVKTDKEVVRMNAKYGAYGLMIGIIGSGVAQILLKKFFA